MAGALIIVPNASGAGTGYPGVYIFHLARSELRLLLAEECIEPLFWKVARCTGVGCLLSRSRAP